MFVHKDVGDAVELADRNFTINTQRHDLGAGQRSDPFDDDPINFVTRSQTLALISITLGGCEFGLAHCRCDTFEHLVGSTGDSHPFVVDGSEMPVRNSNVATSAFTLANLAEQAVCRSDLVHLTKDGFVNAHVDDRCV